MGTPAWMERAPAALMDAAGRGAIVLVAALVLTALLRRRSASARHAVWVGALAAQLVVLVLTVWGPRWNVAAPAPLSALVPAAAGAPDPVFQGSTVSPAPAAGGSEVRERVVPESVVRQSVPHPDTRLAIRPATLVAALWMLGALAVLLRLAIGTAVVARLARRGDRVDDGGWLSLAQRLATTLGISRPLILLRGDRVAVPITWGIVYPIVLLPDDADAWPEERRRFVLVHEMAHVKRLDALTQLLGQVALALFWFDPLVWIANRRMQLEREHACDDYVLRHGTLPSQYATDLLEMVCALGTPAHRDAQPAFAALAMARRSEFEGRMLSILDPVLDRHPLSKGRTLMSAFAALLVIVPLAALHPHRAAAAATTSLASAAPQSPSTSQAGSMPSLPSQPSAPSYPSSPTRPAAPAPLAPVRGIAPSVPAMPASPASPASPVSPVSPLSPLTATAGSSTERGCTTTKLLGSGSSTSIHSSDDDGTSVVDYTMVRGGLCTHALVAGRITYADDETDIVSMSSSAHAVFRERTRAEDREVAVHQVGGTLVHSQRIDGVDAPYDDAARRWLAGFLPKILIETAVNAGPRVARWRARGGVDEALSRIAAIDNSGSKRAHYIALLDAGRLSGAELDQLVRSASENVRGSSGDLRAILMKAAPNVRLSRGSMPAVESALASMRSSGDQAAVLKAYGETDDPELLLVVMRVARTLGSSGDEARLLQDLAPRYLAKNDRSLEEAYFSALTRIPSSGDMRGTLTAAVPYARRSPEIARRIIESASAVASSGDRANVLITLANADVLTTPALRAAFMTAAAGVPSEGDRARVVEAGGR